MATRLEQLRAKRGARAGGSVFERLRRFGVWKLLFMMFGLGVVLGIASVHLIPVALRLGLAPRLADRLPYLGFASGLLIGGGGGGFALVVVLGNVVYERLRPGRERGA